MKVDHEPSVVIQISVMIIIMMMIDIERFL